METIRNDCTEKPVTRKEVTGILSKLKITGNGVNGCCVKCFFGKNKRIKCSNPGFYGRFDYCHRSVRIFSQVFRRSTRKLYLFRRKGNGIKCAEAVHKRPGQETTTTHSTNERLDEEISMTASDTFRVDTFLVIIDRLVFELEKGKKRTKI